tara:strand:+ start:101 stop:967 length:867 start_codon:yes stop_codon:yes gene_type:complete
MVDTAEATEEAVEAVEAVEEVKEAAPAKEEVADWRAGMSDDLKKTAERFASPDDMVRSVQEARKRESLVRVPGKDSSDEDRASYHKAIGVPETAEGYGFELPEGEEATAESDAANKEWGERLHGLNVPTETVNQLLGFMQKDAAAHEKAETKADEAFVEESIAELKREWKGEEFEKNKDIANQAFKEAANRAGVNLEELKFLQTSNGRFLMDDPRMMKIFSVFGREMSEGSLGPTLTDGQRDTMQDQLSEIRDKISTASNKGDTKAANRFYQAEQKLIAQMNGNKSIN